MDTDAHGRRSGRGRQTDGVTRSTSPDQGGSVTWLPKVCSALLPALLPLVIAFRCLEPNGQTGPQVTVMGCLTASDHCCGQGIPATGVLQQHRPAQALFEGFHTRIYPFPHSVSAISHCDFGIPQQVAANNLSGRTTAIFINGAVQNFRPRPNCVTCR